MSDITPISVPTVEEGTDRVDTLALDAQFALVVEKINEVIIAVAKVREEADTMADGIAHWRTFSARAKRILSTMVDHLVELYEAYDTRWTDLPVLPGTDYGVVGGGQFDGYSADPSSNTWTYTLPGETPALFVLRLLVRHYAAATPAATATITLTGSRTQSWVLNPDPTEMVTQTIQTIVQAGDVLTIEFTPGDEFTGNTDFPVDDLAGRFPYRPRYRACGAFQFDWLSYVPYTPPVLATEDYDALTTVTNVNLAAGEVP
jgi:hypothetical protein